MLCGEKLVQCRHLAKLSVSQLADMIATAQLDRERAISMIRNWERGLMKPRPTNADVDRLASALGFDRQDLLVWSAVHKYAPIAPRKVRLVTQLIQGRFAQEALDILEFANKRAAVIVKKVLKSAIANADEQEADVNRLYVFSARVDEAGIRTGTKRWRPSDRGRSMPVSRFASHIRIYLDMEK
ncbi:MAG: 50S ribosomal protein L22 [Planctomycetes bacterium]|nr:50S ribosomal protein L22 [Planctomycetota bacterium]